MGSGVKVCCVVGFPLGAMSAKAKVKASGGIRTYEQACGLIEAGADRIGAGNGLLLEK